MTAVSLGCWWPTDLLSFRNFPLQGSSPFSEESAQHAFCLTFLQCGTSFKANLGVKAPHRVCRGPPWQIEMTHMSLCPVSCDQMSEKSNLRQGVVFGSQFEGTQAVMAEKAVDTGDRSDWSHCFCSQEAESREVGLGYETWSPPHSDSLPSARFHRLQAPQPSELAPSTGVT